MSSQNARSAREALEHHAQALIAPRVADYATLADDVFAFLSELLAEQEAPAVRTQASMVIARILVRLLDDLRVCAVMAERGYVFQALTIAAGMLELSAATGFIADNDERAERWLSHTDLRNTYPDLAQAIEATVGLLGGDAAAIERAKIQHRDLCMAKHSNPIAMSQIGVELEGDVAHLLPGPQWSDAAIRATRRALSHAVRHPLVAARVFVSFHLEASKKDAAKRRGDVLGRRLQELEQSDARRYANPDVSKGTAT